MLYKKEGYPEEHELVSCTVTKILPQSVFVNINEYAKQGMIHIAEISPGRIRNLRDFVEEGKVIVCKVLHVDQYKGHIDLSLRRATESQRREKNDLIKQEMTAEKVVGFLAEQSKRKVEELYKEIIKLISKDYEFLHDFFNDIVTDEIKMTDYIPDETLASDLEKLVRQRIKLPEVVVGGDLILISYAPNGVDIVKEAVKKALIDKRIDIKFLGGGKFKMSLKSPTYKEAEKLLENSSNAAIEFIKKHDGEGSFTRADAA